jgi:hypothetical protein
MELKPRHLKALDGGKYTRRRFYRLRRVVCVILNLMIGTAVGYAVGILLKCILTYAVLGFIMAALYSVIESEGG